MENEVAIYEAELETLGMRYSVHERSGPVCGAAAVVKVIFQADVPRGAFSDDDLFGE